MSEYVVNIPFLDQARFNQPRPSGDYERSN